MLFKYGSAIVRLDLAR